MPEPNTLKFDRYASSYEQLHASNISISGEGTQYFARYKVECLLRAGVPLSAPILDFGCGIGNVTRELVTCFGSVHGYEPSSVSAEQARRSAPTAKIHDQLDSVPDAHFVAAVLSGVLHHVPPSDRRQLLSDVLTKLAPGGTLFVFEHNPYNPLTRRAVATCEFDDDAILLWPRELKTLLTGAGFADVRLDYIVFFPKALAFLRPLEPKLRWLFAGAQTLTMGKKPG
jgi:SAM-dependent methyltransferase